MLSRSFAAVLRKTISICVPNVGIFRVPSDPQTLTAPEKLPWDVFL